MAPSVRALLLVFFGSTGFALPRGLDAALGRESREQGSDRVAAAEEAFGRGDVGRALTELLAALEADEGNQRALSALPRVLHDPRLVADEGSERAHAILRRHPERGPAVLVNEGEAGDPLVVRGTLRDGAGRPVAGAFLRVFHADAQGHYTPTHVMDEPHARLFAYIESDAEGRFEFRTIRPGWYPGAPDRQGVEWEIPAHVHFEISGEGLRSRRFQLVFADDPRMQPARWREWAVEGRHPVATVERDAAGVQRCTLEVELERSGS